MGNIKSIVKYLLLSCFYILSLRLSMRTPLFRHLLNIEALFIIFLFLFFFLYLINNFHKKNSFSSIELFIIFSLFLPVYGAISALIEFGQPFTYGLQADRDFFFILSGLVLLYLLKNCIVSLPTIKKSFIIMSWFSLFIYFVLWLVIDPQKLIDVAPGFINFSETKGGYLIYFNNYFIVFGAIFYVVKYFETKKILDIVCVLLFFSYLIFLSMARAGILSTVIAIFIFFILYIRRELKIKYFFAFMLIVLPITISFIFVSKMVTPGLFEKYMDMYVNMYKNALTTVAGQKTYESSTYVRLHETAIATKYISKNPIFGNGNLSHHWKGGYCGVFGYFYPMDIGVFGAVFAYGFFGFIFMNIQYLLVFIYLKKNSHLKQDVFLTACKYYLLEQFIFSLSSGQTFFSTSCSIIIIVIIYHYLHSESNTSEKVLGTRP